MFHNYTEEITWLKQKLAQNPRSMLYARLADRYIMMNEVEKAEKIVKNRISSHNGYSTPHLILAKCYLKANRFDEADQEIKKAIKIEPSSLQAYKMQCDIKERIGLDAEVRSGYEKILALDPLDTATKQFLDLVASSQEDPYAPLMEPEFDDDTELLVETEEETYKFDTDIEPEADILDVIDEETTEMQAESGIGEIEEEKLTGFTKPFEQAVKGPEVEEELESFLDDEDADVEERAAQLEEELLLDTDEDAFQAKAAEETFFADEEDEFLESMDSFAAKLKQPKFETTAINDDAILPDIENELEPALDSDIEEEETRFSEILDDIFAPTVDEEERRQEKTRSALEKLADDSDDVEVANIVETPRVGSTKNQAPVEEAKPFLEPEVEDDSFEDGPDFEDDTTDLDDDFSEDPVEFTRIEQEQDAFEEFNPFDDFRETAQDEPGDKFEDAEFEPIELNDEQEAEEQFVDFLASVDSDEASVPAAMEREDFYEEEDEPEPELTPGPEYHQPPVTPPRPRVNTERPKEKFVTPTLGEIYAAQGQYAKAINVFELLLEKHPDNEWYRSKLDDLKEKLEQQKDK